jgi:hypothetical protein
MSPPQQSMAEPVWDAASVTATLRKGNQNRLSCRVVFKTGLLRASKTGLLFMVDL